MPIEMQRRFYPIAKRLIDLAGAATGLILLSPLLLIVSIAIVRDSPGPVLYRGLRVGRRGIPFSMLKFRTMVVNAELMGASSTQEGDPRITRVGRWLRRYKIDELPQLINVLKGEMSLVGPRPQVPWAVALYSTDERAVLSMRPGMTDYASLAFRHEGEILRGSVDPDQAYLEKIHPHKMRLSLQYVRDASLWTDLRIIATTIRAVLKWGDHDHEALLEGRGSAQNRG